MHNFPLCNGGGGHDDGGGGDDDDDGDVGSGGDDDGGGDDLTRRWKWRGVDVVEVGGVRHHTLQKQ